MESPINAKDDKIAYLAMCLDENFGLFGKDAVVAALKKHFRDDCGYGGKVINMILCVIETSLNIEHFQIETEIIVKDENEFGRKDGELYGDNAVGLMSDVLTEWKKNEKMTPDPWWGS